MLKLKTELLGSKIPFKKISDCLTIIVFSTFSTKALFSIKFISIKVIKHFCISLISMFKVALDLLTLSW